MGGAEVPQGYQPASGRSRSGEWVWLFIFQLEKPRRFVAIPVSDMRPADDGLPAFGVTTFASVRAAALPGDGFDGEAFVDASDAAPGDPIGFGIASVISDAQVGVARGTLLDLWLSGAGDHEEHGGEDGEGLERLHGR